MSELRFNVDVKKIRDEIQDEANSYVKHIWQDRKDACIEAVGDVLEEHGYLPDGTTWEAWNGACWFSVVRDDAELGHYFHEGMIYGPNIPIFSDYKNVGGKRIGIGEPIKYRSPKGKPKHPNGGYLNQYPGSHLGVQHWTKAVEEGGELYGIYEDRCKEILRR